MGPLDNLASARLRRQALLVAAFQAEAPAESPLET